MNDMGLLRRRSQPKNNGPVDPVRAAMTDSIIADLREMVRELNQLTAQTAPRTPEDRWKK